MRLLSTKSCQSGMKLGKPIYNEDGVILLGAQVELTMHLINRLQQMGIDYVYILDKDTEDVEIIEPISDETRIKAMAEIRTNFRALTEASTNMRAMKSPMLGKAFNNVLQMIIEDLSGSQGALIMLMNMNVMNNYLYSHSLNVTIITITLGIIHGYSRTELIALGLGSMLHDIGKTKINQQLLNKRGSLTPEEYSEIQSHAILGYQLLKEQPGIPLLSAHCALQHHERIDGSGYPRGIAGDEIHDFAKLLAIADSYDAMTTHRAHRNAMLPHQAMEILYGSAGTLFDRKKVALFRDNVAIYPLGLSVALNTGEQGVVVKINPHYPQRPVIRIFKEPDGKMAYPLYEIDLAEKLNIMIHTVSE